MQPDPAALPTVPTPYLDDRPRFSLVIPAYNEERYLGDCLRSLADQDYPGAFEVIVVDNNSTDGTAQVARDLGARVVGESEQGVCAARHRGTSMARGEIVISADADTSYPPGWLSRVDASFRDNPEAVAVAGPCQFVDAPLWGRMYPKALFGLVALVRRLTGHVFYVSATNLAFRRSSWPGYDTRLTQGGDEVDLLRKLRRCGPVMFDLGNPSLTSSRRLRRGLFYNFAVTFFFYYLMAYWLNRLTGRHMLGNAPAFRADPARRVRPIRVIARAAFACTVVGLVCWAGFGPPDLF